VISRRGKATGGSRTADPDGTELWQAMTRSVDRIKAKPRVGAHDTPVTTRPEVRRPPPAARDVQPPKPSPPSPPPREALPLADVDRRTARQISAGKIAIEARIDLHGVRQSDARARLIAFLQASQAAGCKTVLVITGKGSESKRSDYVARVMGEPERGVLRRAVPQWLAEPALRSVVLSFATAGPRHGGDGAFYVLLRRPGRDAR
jgi:DNA-nicking Smr family endonuclease